MLLTDSQIKAFAHEHEGELFVMENGKLKLVGTRSGSNESDNVYSLRRGSIGFYGQYGGKEMYNDMVGNMDNIMNHSLSEVKNNKKKMRSLRQYFNINGIETRSSNCRYYLKK